MNSLPRMFFRFVCYAVNKWKRINLPAAALVHALLKEHGVEVRSVRHIGCHRYRLHPRLDLPNFFPRRRRKHQSSIRLAGSICHFTRKPPTRRTNIWENIGWIGKTRNTEAAARIKKLCRIESREPPHGCQGEQPPQLALREAQLDIESVRPACESMLEFGTQKRALP